MYLVLDSVLICYLQVITGYVILTVSTIQTLTIYIGMIFNLEIMTIFFDFVFYSVLITV